MLRNVSNINHHGVAASDGRIGTVVDFLFDDVSWHLRWAIVKIDLWPLTRKVLIPASAFLSREPSGLDLSVQLTMQKIRECPGVDTDRPVSRQMETHIFDHYDWPPYWADGLYFSAYGYAGGTSPFSRPSPEEREILDAQRSHDDPHLRSIEVVGSYHVHARDGEIGHVESMLVDDADWTIRYLLIDTKNWWRGKRVLVAPAQIKGFDWRDKRVNIDMDRQTLATSAPYNPSEPLAALDQTSRDSTMQVANRLIAPRF